MKAPAAHGTARTVGSAAVAKIVVMGLSGVLGILTSKMIIEHFGTAAYAQYGLLTSLPGLLPFADLGLAAVVINTVAASPDVRSDDAVRRVLTTVFRVLLGSAAVLALVAVTISLLGLWPALLGNGLIEGAGPVSALVGLLVFAVVLPLSIGQRVLVGLRRTTTQIASQTVVAPFMLLSIGLCVALALPVGGYLAILSFIGNGLVSVICLVIAARALAPQLRLAVADVPRIRAVPGVKVLGMAWPMLVQMLALPVAMQTDRLLISHLTHGDQLAQYNLASQLFGLVLQTISASGIVLWPIYARARAQASTDTPWRATAAFAAIGLALGLVLAAASPLLVDFVSSGRAHLDGWLVSSFVFFVALQAAKYPLGMYMTDKRGLTFQIWPILVLVPLNLGLSWWLIGVIGAGGTVLASAVSVLLCQVVPNVLWVRREVARRRRERSEPLEAQHA